MKIKKIILTIKKIITSILAVLFFGFAIAMTILLLNYNKYGVTQFDNTSLIIIKEEISSDNYAKGDLVLVEGKPINRINPGDEIFIYQVNSSGIPRIDLGIIGEVHIQDNAISFENGATYSMDFAIGEASQVYNEIGTYLSMVTSKWGFLFIILLPSFLIFIGQLYALVIEIRYGGEEEVLN